MDTSPPVPTARTRLRSPPASRRLPPVCAKSEASRREPAHANPQTQVRAVPGKGTARARSARWNRRPLPLPRPEQLWVKGSPFESMTARLLRLAPPAAALPRTDPLSGWHRNPFSARHVLLARVELRLRCACRSHPARAPAHKQANSDDLFGAVYSRGPWPTRHRDCSGGGIRLGTDCHHFSLGSSSSSTPPSPSSPRMECSEGSEASCRAGVGGLGRRRLGGLARRARRARRATPA